MKCTIVDGRFLCRSFSFQCTYHIVCFLCGVVFCFNNVVNMGVVFCALFGFGLFLC
jgi:hypothetical protein